MSARTASRALFCKTMIALWLGLCFVQVVGSWAGPDGLDSVDQMSMAGRRLMAPTPGG